MRVFTVLPFLLTLAAFFASALCWQAGHLRWACVCLSPAILVALWAQVGQHEIVRVRARRAGAVPHRSRKAS